METGTTAQLHDVERASAFYDDRYKSGYMEEYPAATKERISGIIESLNLPSTGNAIDFGCGNGVLTEVLRQALPQWSVYGVDLSKRAIENAKSRFPQCTFVEFANPELKAIKFDFLFSHHVLEHVSDLQSSADQITSYLSASSSMLHVLPCGNVGSYEHRLCTLRSDGINHAVENRFFFEDESHLRRLTTAQMSELFGARNFDLQHSFYTHQYHGAVEWLTNHDAKWLCELTNLSKAKNTASALSLSASRLKLLLIAACRKHARLSAMLMRDRKWTPKRIIATALLLPLYPLTNRVSKHIEEQARREWKNDCLNPAGSEMALHFRRNLHYGRMRTI